MHRIEYAAESPDRRLGGAVRHMRGRAGRVSQTGYMSIQVAHDDAGWHLRAGPPHTVEARSATVGTPTEALATLTSWGCHSTDATDALYEADPAWTRTHDEEVRRRRTDGGQ